MIGLIKGDITRIQVDAIVNAANSGLMGGGGVDGAIHRAGGQTILEECKKIRESSGKCKTGDAVITSAGKLPARYVIHTVGPVWKGGINGESKLLKNAYLNSLRLAKKHQLKTIAFPNISTGVYGYPKAEAASVAIHAVREFTLDHPEIIVSFVCFDEENYKIYESLL